MPVTMPAAGASLSHIPQAASGEIQNGVSASTSGAIRSRRAACPARDAARCTWAAAEARLIDLGAQIADERGHALAIGAKLVGGRLEMALDHVHAVHQPQQSVL